MTGSTMLKIFPTAIAAMFLACAAWAQEQAQNSPPEEKPQAPSAQTDEEAKGDTGTADTKPGSKAENEADSAAGEATIPDEDDKSILDDQTFEGEDDDFIPTEEIPVNEPIPFPTDI